MKKTDIVVARRTTFVMIDGRRELIRKDKDRARAGAPIVEQNPDLWKPLNVKYDIEQATAAPGEKRQAKVTPPSPPPPTPGLAKGETKPKRKPAAKKPKS